MSDLKVLIFGGTGMLGHKLASRLPEFGYDVTAAVRGDSESYSRFGILEDGNVIGGVDVRDLGSLKRAIGESKPDVVVNAVGIIKQKDASAVAVETIEINSVFPHRLFDICSRAGIRVITISTDCVFSGNSGNYSEDDLRDAEDLYGRSKALGELFKPGSVTLRTSIIGRELSGAHGLLEWFLSQAGRSVRGFTKAVFSGLTTLELARVIGKHVIPNTDLSGLYHVSSEPIDKYSLLKLVDEVFRTGTEIIPDGDLVIDRSLNSERFRESAVYDPPTWEEMVLGLKEDPTPYDKWRAQNF